MLAPGEAFHGFVVDALVGHGGSGVVYLAHRPDDEWGPVALKVLDDQHRDEARRNRLRRECDFAREVAHPYVVEVLDCGSDWLAMEYLGGGPVTKLTRRTDVLGALAQAAAALDHAHLLGVVHCDVKPANILLAEPFSATAPPARAKLVDFGSARALAVPFRRQLHVEASLPYAAPEVLRGHPPTAASDEYALACTAVELLTGAPPFVAATAMGLVDAQLNSPVPRYSRRFDWMPRAFDSMLAKAMAKDPDARYPRCAEFVTLITKALIVN